MGAVVHDFMDYMRQKVTTMSLDHVSTMNQMPIPFLPQQLHMFGEGIEDNSCTIISF